MKKKILMLEVMGILLFGGVANAQGNDIIALDTVYVTSNREALPGGIFSSEIQVGSLGKKNIMDIPLTAYSINRKTLDSFADNNLPANSVLLNAPSVKGGATLTHNDFSIRGHYLQGASFYLNNIPGLYSQMNAPTYFIDKVELISGPNMLGGTQMEKNSVSGYVNFVSKKAEETPNASFKLIFTGRTNFSEYIDAGTKFGKNNEWGFRVNGELQNGEMSLKNSDVAAKGVFVNIDHKNEKSESNLLIGYRHQEVKRGMRWFKMNNKITSLPKVPSSKNNVSFDQMLKEENSTILAFNHEHKISEKIGFFANIGMLNSDLKRNISPRGSAYDILNENGDYKFVVYNGRTPNQYRYYEAGFTADFNIGKIENHMIISLDNINQKSFTNSKINKSGKTFTGNLYQGNPNIPWQELPLVDKSLSAKTKLYGVSLVDTMDYGKWRLTIGAHKHKADVKQYNLNGTLKKRVTAEATSPLFGLLYKVNENLSVYASHTEAFSKGDLVGPGYVNEGSIINPAKSKENEVGLKYKNDNLFAGFSYFEIKEKSNLDETRPDGKYKVQNGETEFKGVELSVSGKISPKLTGFGGVMYVDAKRNKTQGGLLDGKKLDGSSKWNGVLGLNYEIDAQTELFGRMLYNGVTFVNQEKLKLPSYTTFDLGIRRSTNVMGTNAIFTAACYNLFNKNYWMTRSGGNEVLLSLPRTWMLSAQFNF